MIPTLVITILVESAVVTGYSSWHRKPFQPILFTSAAGNLVTQSALWVILNFFFRQYLAALMITEILIWLCEGVLLYAIPANRLRWSESLFLSLVMNLSSLGLGLLLPI